MTDDDQVHDIDIRIKEAVGYVQSCCMDGRVTVDVPAGSLEKFCPWTDPLIGGTPADCPAEEGGVCPANPNAEWHNGRLHISTIFGGPRLNWCGCTPTGDQTTGYSGRCIDYGNGPDAAFYKKYEDLAKQICDAA